MKYVNPGICALLSACSGTQHSNDKDTARFTNSPTGYCILLDNGQSLSQVVTPTKELWCSYDFYGMKNRDADVTDTTLGAFYAEDDTLIGSVRIANGGTAAYLGVYDATGKLLYKTDNTFSYFNTLNNVEIHFKTGVNGRVDVWINTKLFFSYRSPTAFADVNVKRIFITGGNSTWQSSTMDVSAIIIQDTRRIGLEKFKKLTINPATEQNMAQGSTTSYTLSGLTDAAEFSDITGVVALLQPTSRDANITTGTFALNGAEVGTVDVSSSSGKDFVEAVSTVNAQTTKPWTRDDIEGKTLTLKVDGAV